MHNEFTVPHEVFENQEFIYLSARSKILYCYLAKLRNRFSDIDGWFWRSIKQLSVDTGMSERSIKYAKNELIEHGFIKIQRGKYKKFNKRAPDYYRLPDYKDGKYDH